MAGGHTGNAPATRRPNGRPTKLTAPIADAAIALAATGAGRSAVARALGVTPRTLRRWMESGRRSPDGIHGRFLAGVCGAEAAAAEARMVAHLAAAGKEDWRAAVKFLERKYPQRWGRNRHRGELVALRRQVRELEEAVRRLRPPAVPGPVAPIDTAAPTDTPVG